MKFKILTFTAIAALMLAACSKQDAGNASPANNTNANTASTGQPAPNSNANAITNANSNANANKPADSGPKRIAFSKGANWGAVNITLAPGEAQKFVVSAKAGQTMDVEASSKEVAINLRKGKAETTEDFGFLNAELQANGDYVFEVRNSTKKEVKTSVKVTIEKAKSDEDAVPVDDDDEPSGSAPKDN